MPATVASHDPHAFDQRAELRGQLLDGRYRIGHRIGVGGTGVVFDLAPLAGETPLVLKVLRRRYVDHPDLPRRLRREAEVARRVAHPGVLRVLEEGTLYDGSPYLVLPRLRGESLASLLRRRGPLTPREACSLAIRVAAILHAVHGAGYTHRDIKPDHIRLDTSPSGDLRVWLIDFGVCASPWAPAEERARERGRVFGTPSYASPEQASGNPDVDGRADLFGLGLVMFEMLTGKPAFHAASVNHLLLRIIQEDAPRLRTRLAHVDPQLDALMKRLLARHPAARPDNARKLARALAPHAGGRLAAERQVAQALRTPHRRATAAAMRAA